MTNAVTPEKEKDASTQKDPCGCVTYTPRVDIYETDESLVMLADLPGVKPEDVDIRFENNELLLKGSVEPRHAERKRLYGEYGVGDFFHAFSLSDTIDAEKISAELKNGVLTLQLPKVEAVKPRRIKVTGG